MSTCGSSASVEAKWEVQSEKYPGKRLHVRTIVRDGRRAFVGSQSLRKLELDKRREVGVIVDDAKVVKQLPGRLRGGLGRRPTPGQEVG